MTKIKTQKETFETSVGRVALNINVTLRNKVDQSRAYENGFHAVAPSQLGSIGSKITPIVGMNIYTYDIPGGMPDSGHLFESETHYLARRGTRFTKHVIVYRGEYHRPPEKVGSNYGRYDGDLVILMEL